MKSSSRELCYIILAGIFLGYLCTFSLIAKPHVVYCYLQRLGIGLSPAMSYSALVTKVQEEGFLASRDRGLNLGNSVPNLHASILRSRSGVVFSMSEIHIPMQYVQK